MIVTRCATYRLYNVSGVEEAPAINFNQVKRELGVPGTPL